MEALIAFLESECCENLLLALAHTLWQAALVVGVLYLYLRRAPATVVNGRYTAAVVALAAIVLCALLTWSILGYEPALVQSSIAPLSAAADDPAISEPTTPNQQSPTPATKILPPSSRSRQTWIMGAWLAGVGVMFL